MTSMHRHPGIRRDVSITAAAALAILTVASTALAGYSPAQVLRSAPEGIDLLLRDTASKGDDVAVVWQEDGPNGPASFLRISDDGGQTFDRRLRIGAEGSRVREPQVDICDGHAFAVGGVAHDPTHPNRWDIALASAKVGGGGTNLEDNFLGFDEETRVARPDIACAGDRALVGAWFDTANETSRVEVLIREIDFCGDMCTGPGFWQRFDLGRGRVRGGLSVAATNDMVYVAWMRGRDLRLKRFALGAPGSITPLPAVTVFEIGGFGGGSPMLAASGELVTLVYHSNADARVRISEDSGRTFGPHTTYIDGPRPPSDAAGVPTSVDMRGSRILLGGVYFCCGSGPLRPTASSHLSTDAGASWTESRHSILGIQSSVLLSTPSGTRVAEAWDHRFDGFEPPAHQRLRFRVDTP